MQSKEYYMSIALSEAKIASGKGEVPVGAVVVDESGEIISRGHNLRESTFDPTAHAEIVALREASVHRSAWNLSGCTMYVTLEPCVMCSGAIVNARIDKLYYGALDERYGGTDTLYRIPTDVRLNHRTEVEGGVMRFECREVLKEFFAGLRQKSKPPI